MWTLEWWLLAPLLIGALWWLDLLLDALVHRDPGRPWRAVAFYAGFLALVYVGFLAAWSLRLAGRW